jgi:UDP-N-acetylglucosamine 2-epimerase
MYRENNSPQWLHCYRNFSAEDYARLISNARCLIGNSSSGIREGAFLGVPVVNIGTRQNGRECGGNVITVGYNAESITTAINEQLKHGSYKSENLYGSGGAGNAIANILASSKVKIQKQFRS